MMPAAKEHEERDNGHGGQQLVVPRKQAPSRAGVGPMDEFKKTGMMTFSSSKVFSVRFTTSLEN